MNISPDGVTVRFKTEPEDLFMAEKSSAKPNTVRILDIDEYHQLRKHNPKKIIIQHQQEVFLRTITNIHATKGVFGKVIVVISWTNEEHHHAMPIEPGPGDHNMRLDPTGVCLRNGETATETVKSDAAGAAPIDLSQIAILIPRTLLAGLNLQRRTTPIPEFISKLLEEYRTTRAEERGPLHD